MAAIQGNVQTIVSFKFSLATAITTTASNVSTLVVPVAGLDATTDTIVAIQPTAIANYTSSFIPTINGMVTAPGQMTVYFYNQSSAHSTVIAAGETFKVTVIRQENGFVNNSL